jgi:ubiquinone/menaquinone biosynthesis C-methylase UbiE
MVVRQARAAGSPFTEWARRYPQLHLDLGTGDGTYVVRKARKEATTGVVGIDTCLDHIRGSAKCQPANARFIGSDARSLPAEFSRQFGSVSINFPFGNLLEAIRAGDERLIAEIDRVAADRAEVEIVVNESAMARRGVGFGEAWQAIERFGRRLPGFRCSMREMSTSDLRTFPSAWSRRQGYGRQPRAIRLTARR